MIYLPASGWPHAWHRATQSEVFDKSIEVCPGRLTVLTLIPLCVRTLCGWATKRGVPQALGHQGPGAPDVPGRHQEVPSASLIAGQGNRIIGTFALLSERLFQALDVSSNFIFFKRETPDPSCCFLSWLSIRIAKG